MFASKSISRLRGLTVVGLLVFGACSVFEPPEDTTDAGGGTGGGTGGDASVDGSLGGSSGSGGGTAGSGGNAGD